ncbi:ABC transporter permease, partial [Bacillus sp. SIMBA_161]
TSDFSYYAFHVPDWTETVSIGENVRYPISEAMVSGNFAGLNYYFENPGYEYRWFKSSFALLLFIGLMVAAVFLLAAG